MVIKSCLLNCSSIKWASGGESVPKSHVRAIQYVISFFYQIIYQNMKKYRFITK